MRIGHYILISIFMWSVSSADGFMQIRGDYRLMFYNVENLFDTKDNPIKEDDDFTPTGTQHWTQVKYQRKLQNIYRAIAAVGSWKPPDIIGLCEVENIDVLTDLLLKTPLLKYHYSIVHFDSPDTRGIDVALLYNRTVSLLQKQAINVPLLGYQDRFTRDILYVKLMVAGVDTLHLFVNHWPSRRGGELESENLRIDVAKLLKTKVDSLWNRVPCAKIIVMGDFNDEPDNQSVAQFLNATDTIAYFNPTRLYNLTTFASNLAKIGTLKYNGRWFTFDQVIVSGSLLETSQGVFTKASDAHILTDEFLLVPDVRNMGNKPHSTFSGPRYNGGFSDHLPVYLDLFFHK